jgi:hypothetical protein
MTPESSEGRERITRLEERVGANSRQIATLGALPLQVERVQWKVDELGEDLRKYEREADSRFDKFEARQDDRDERILRSVSQQIASCSDQIAKVAETQKAALESLRELQTAERDRSQREADDRAENEREAKSATERAIAKYGQRATLGAAVIAAGAAIFNNFFG